MALQVDTFGTSIAFRAIMLQYDWMNVAFIYATDNFQQMCSFMATDFQDAMDTTADIAPTIVFMQQMNNATDAVFKSTLAEVKQRARSEFLKFQVLKTYF